MSNPFDLRKKPPIYQKQDPPPSPASQYTPSSQSRQSQQPQSQQPQQPIPTDKLEGYFDVPRDQWQSISVGSHIRYIRMSGEFRTGGFIREKTTNDDGHDIFVLENDKVNRKGSKYRTFPIVLDEISHIYKKGKSDTARAPRQQSQQSQQSRQYQQPPLQSHSQFQLPIYLHPHLHLNNGNIHIKHSLINRQCK